MRHLASVAALAAAFLVHEGFARSTPLGNSALGTSTSNGGANGVPSPSGPGVHPGYKMTSFRSALDTSWRFGGIDWLSDGRMVAVTWGSDQSYGIGQTGWSSGTSNTGPYGDVGIAPDGKGPGAMFILTGTTGTSITSTNITKIYSGLWEALGLYVARSGNVNVADTIYVITKTGLLRFIGTGPYVNGTNPVKVIGACNARVCADSVAPGKYGSFSSHAPKTIGTGRRWHHFTTGLVRDAQGFFYASTIGEYDNGNPRLEQGRDRCAVLKLDAKAGTQEVIAGGMRSPNGMVIGPEDELFSSDIQGNFQAANKIVNIRPGRFYGMRCDTLNPYGHTRGIAESFPVVALNQGGSANTDIANNPAEITYMRSGPYRGQLLYGDVTFGGIQRVFVEKVNGEWQGAVFVHTAGFRAGIGRLRQGPDGSLYAASQAGGAQSSSGNWCWGGDGPPGALTADRPNNMGGCNKQYDLARLDPKDTVVFELLAVRSRFNGFELQFTKKVGPSAGVPSNYTVRHWANTMSMQTYGGGSQAGGVQTSSIASVRISPDSTRVFLELAAMPAVSVRPVAAPSTSGNGNVRVVHIRAAEILAADGSKVWGEPATAGAVPSIATAWYTLNFISPDTAFAPVALDPALSAPELSQKGFKVRRAGGSLLIDLPFEQASKLVLRDFRGKALARRDNAAGRRTIELPVAGYSKGAYLIEVRVGGKAFSRPVSLF